ncbi:MAG: hypothetical protein MI864_00365 [Pseudomonadales bacterium]|nr:hypothetical protein [Pseudomonadales bacterium]
MSTTLSVSTDGAAAMLNPLSDLLDSGNAKVYSGTPPANADASLSGNTLLGTCPLSATSAPDTTTKTLTFNAITSDSSADASGTASFFRLESSGGDVHIQGLCGTTSAYAMVMTTTTITAGGTLPIASCTITMP